MFFSNAANLIDGLIIPQTPTAFVKHADLPPIHQRVRQWVDDAQIARLLSRKVIARFAKSNRVIFHATILLHSKVATLVSLICATLIDSRLLLRDKWASNFLR